MKNFLISTTFVIFLFVGGCSKKDVADKLEDTADVLETSADVLDSTATVLDAIADRLDGDDD